MDESPRNLIRPAAIGGLLLGAFAGLPFFDVLNMCTCCSMVIGAGFLAAYLQSSERARSAKSFRAGDGALVGLVAGGFYAIASTLVSAAVGLVLGDLASGVVVDVLEDVPRLSPEHRELLETWLEHSGELAFLGLVLEFFFHLLIGVIFATVGGLIGGAVFKVEPPPPSAQPSGSDPQVGSGGNP